MASIFNYREFIRESIRVELEVISMTSDAIQKIENILKTHHNCKIGKTSDIENRFDKAYKDAGYVDIIRICKSKSKKVIDRLEIDLTKHFADKIENERLGGGQKSYTNDYWIYVVHKGKKS